MAKPIPEKHPLRLLFDELAHRNFIENIRLTDQDIIRYISDLLSDFVHTDAIFKLRNTEGRRLDDIGEMLMESQEARQIVPDAKIERDIRKHIGDYILFFTGMFPEFLKKTSKGLRLDYFLDYIQTGKQSYSIVAESSIGRLADERSLFLKLSENFDYCVVGLNFIRADLEKLQDPHFRQIKRIIGS